MKRELTIAGLIASLSRFAPATRCVAHIWVADDFEVIDSELSPDEGKRHIAAVLTAV